MKPPSVTTNTVPPLFSWADAFLSLSFHGNYINSPGRGVGRCHCQSWKVILNSLWELILQSLNTGLLWLLFLQGQDTPSLSHTLTHEVKKLPHNLKLFKNDQARTDHINTTSIILLISTLVCQLLSATILNSYPQLHWWYININRPQFSAASNKGLHFSHDVIPLLFCSLLLSPSKMKSQHWTGGKVRRVLRELEKGLRKPLIKAEVNKRVWSEVVKWRLQKTFHHPAHHCLTPTM